MKDIVIIDGIRTPYAKAGTSRAERSLRQPRAITRVEVAEFFARRGFAGVGLREGAAQVGLGKSSLFHHFRSKAQLYLAVIDRVLDDIEQRLTGVLASGGSPLDRLDRVVDAFIDGLAERNQTSRSGVP